MILPEKYLILNGKIQPSQSSVEKNIDIVDWISSSFVIKWRSSGTRIPFYSQQYKRLLDIIDFFDRQATGLEDEQRFHDLITRLIQRNRLFKGVELNICIRPDADSLVGINYMVICKKHPNEEFLLNEKGLLLKLAYPPNHPGQKAILDISQDSFESSYWKNQAIEQEADILYFTNQKKQLLETNFARLYLIKGDRIFTPAYTGLNIWGIEQSIKAAAKELGLQFSRSSSILTAHLNQTDELFIANDLIGIQWIMGYNDKRFFKKRSPLILKKINNEWKNSN